MNKRKYTTSVTPNSSGITITDSISLTFNSKYWINSRILLIIISLAGIAGFTLSFLSLFDFECNRSMIYTAEAMAFIVSSVICMFPSKTKVLLVPLYILAGYGIYRNRLDFSYGYAGFINTIAESLRITSPGQPYYRIPESADTVQCLTLFLMFMFMVLTTIICYNTIVKPRFIIVFSCTFPFIETGLMFGFSPSHIPFALLISYWTAVFAMRIAGNQYHTESGKPVFVRKKNIFVSSGNLRNNVIEDIGIITLVSAFAVFLVSSAVISIFSIERPDKVKEARSVIKSAISDFSIEKIANSAHGNDAELNPATDKSQLGNIAKVTFQDKTDLTVYITGKPSGAVYLKGFVGSVYDNNTWYSASDSLISENSGIFSSFERTGYYPQYFNYYNDTALSSSGIKDFRRFHVIINSWFKSNRYAFTTYDAAPSDGIIPEKDAFFSVDNLNSYSFDTYTSPEIFKNPDLIYSNSELLNREISETEKQYRNLVYNNYLLLPESSMMNELAAEYAYIPDYNGKNIDEIYKEIRSVLYSSVDYSLEPGKTPVSSEITYYMLKENHKGYCSHFATAAVVLARLNGVPARYAEGYIVLPSDTYKAEKINSYYKIDVQDSRAHAWAEFYIDGYGWVPFEFTPGYDKGIISAEEIMKKGYLNTDTEDAAVTTEVTEAMTEEVTAAPEIVTEIITVTEIVEAPASEEPAPDFTEFAGTEMNEASDSSSDDDNSGKPISKMMSVLLVILKMILSAVLTVALISAVIFSVHILKLRKRIMSFRCKSTDKGMMNIYGYILELLAHTGIRKGNMLPLEFAEYTEEHIDGLLDKGCFTDFMHTVLKAGYSSEHISSEELRNAEKTANTLAENIYRRKNKREKFIFRYILNLCK